MEGEATTCTFSFNNFKWYICYIIIIKSVVQDYNIIFMKNVKI